MTVFKTCAVAALCLLGTSAAFAQGSTTIDKLSKSSTTFWSTDNVTLSKKSGRLCATVPAGTVNPWDAIIGSPNITLEQGKSYHLSATVFGEPGGPVRALVQRASAPYPAQVDFNMPVSPEGKAFSSVFTATESSPAQLVFQLGGQPNERHICFEKIAMAEATGDEVASINENPVRVNQLGYFIDGPKRATIVSSSQTPLAYTLLDRDGRKRGEGMTQPLGLDESAGLETHIADFSPFRLAGTGYKLEVEGQQSFPFSIGGIAYDALTNDALSWFYLARSGTEIRADIAGTAYARPAGHIGVAPNLGDTDVGCLEGPVAKTLYDDWSCTYRLDVSGGWYDAGDQGKYVVNGAIAVSQLLASFERAKTFSEGASSLLLSGVARVPERGNGVPDVLNEARWELEFLLKMMVPDGQPLAGMVHHKVHDTKWTGTPMLPHLDPETRALHRPSTAATLDMAAAAAQGARLYGAYDKKFADTLLDAAEKAWAAAQKNPVLLAPKSDGMQGGGDYDDDDISDETYWAAAELYITTGKDTYLKALNASPWWGKGVFAASGAFDWRSVAGYARIELALYAKKLAADDLAMVQGSVTSAAKDFLAHQKREPFGHIYRPGEGLYNWGSNQLVLQNMVVLSAAFDLTGDRTFLDGVRESMDYLLGRNAMNLSYITGYGAQSAHNQYSRWFAHSIDTSLPPPPPGSLAGGPNSTLVDDVGRADLQGCAPQRCYVDKLMSFGTNEIAINWNAPLVYVASFLADAK